jgi:hypothetical protein
MQKMDNDHCCESGETRILQVQPNVLAGKSTWLAQTQVYGCLIFIFEQTWTITYTRLDKRTNNYAKMLSLTSLSRNLVRDSSTKQLHQQRIIAIVHTVLPVTPLEIKMPFHLSCLPSLQLMLLDLSVSQEHILWTRLFPYDPHTPADWF